MKRIFSLITLFASLRLLAYDIAVENDDGVVIYYNYINDAKELEVTYNNSKNYRDNIVNIPETVTYMNRTRRVTAIGYSAFSYFDVLTSVSLPNSILTIGDWAFGHCSYLTAITIPNSVITIADNAFNHCSRLTSVTIPNGVLTIGDEAFRGCSCLTSITIPNSVTSIGIGAFSDCNSLTSIIILNRLTTIEDYVFNNCSSLTSITIPDGVTSIGRYAFAGCYNLTGINIPNGVSTIGENAFSGCKKLTFATIPNTVTSIGDGAFSDCDIALISSLIENPFYINDNVFSKNSYYNATLKVPIGAVDKYHSVGGWNNFMFIEDGAVSPDFPTCAKPSISYVNGQLFFESETEGVHFVTDIIDADVKEHYDAIISLTATYIISVYAVKDGFDNSEVAIATLCWIDAEPIAEGTKEAEDNVTEVWATPVLIHAEGNTITVQGAAEGTDITVYNTAGVKLCSAIANKGITTLNTQFPSGNTAIVKIGEKPVKVIVK